MANLLQQRALDEVVRQYAGQYGLPDHKALLFLVIERYLSDLNLNSIDIEESIVDGSDDCGIDAIVIDEEAEDRPHIYFFQSKYFKSENAFERQFEGTAIDKIQGAVNDFVLQGRINKKYQNARLVDKLHSVRNLGSRNPTFTIVLCSNSDEPSTAAKAKLDDFIRDTNRTAGDYISVAYLHLDKITRELIAPQQKARINMGLQISGRYLTEDTVNGQQTARSLHKASISKALKPDTKVLVRIVETKDPELLLQIIEATNSQTRVTSRDLHSNDQIQKLIEQHFASNGYFYEARKNKYAGKETSKRVDAEVAAQAFYAVFFKQPAVAKDKKKILFGDEYDKLFNEQTNPMEILYSFRLLRTVQRLNNQKEYADGYTFLKDATLHILALMDEVYVRQNGCPIDLEKPKEVDVIYRRVLESLSEVVKQRIVDEGDKYEHRRTFKDPETYGRAVEILNLGLNFGRPKIQHSK